VFREDLIKHIRRCSWDNLILYHEWKPSALYAKVIYLVSLLKHISTEEVKLFNYIPEAYIYTLLDTFHALRRGTPPFKFLQNASYKAGFQKIIAFLALHFGDSRIINPDIRDMLLQSISVLLRYHYYIREIENMQCVEHLIPSLIQAFSDSRFWVSVSNVLISFWQGTGFAFPNQETGSKIIRKTIKNISITSAEYTQFLNKVFNNLNWTVSETHLAIKSLLQAAQSKSTSQCQHFQKKIITMMELVINLMRIVELLARELPHSFENQVNATRLCELLLFFLNRTTTGPESKTFNMVLQSGLGISPANHSSLIAPAAGVLLNMHAAGPDFVKTLVSDEALNLGVFKFLCSYDWVLEGEGPHEHHHKKLAKLKAFVHDLEKLKLKQEEKKSSKPEQEEEDSQLCTICCTRVMDCTFFPCEHRSCYGCISRALLSSKECFFCRTEVQSVKKDSLTKVVQ